jgi:hypothetical protein
MRYNFIKGIDFVTKYPLQQLRIFGHEHCLLQLHCRTLFLTINTTVLCALLGVSAVVESVVTHDVDHDLCEHHRHAAYPAAFLIKVLSVLRVVQPVPRPPPPRLTDEERQ